MMKKYIWQNEKFSNFKVDMGQLVEAESRLYKVAAKK